MTNLELLHDLNRRHARLEVSLADLKDDLHLLNTRLNRAEATTVATPPPVPNFMPPIPEPISVPPPVPSPAQESFSAVPEIPVMPPLPEIPPPVFAAQPEPAPPPETAPVEGAGLEIQVGRWLARIGVVFALFTVIFFGALVKERYYHYLGPWSKVTILTLVSTALIATGLRLEKRDSKMLVYGRTLAGGGMACLYYTLFGASYVSQLQVIHDPALSGFLLLAWSAGVLFLAERRKSELLSIFAISLAYFSSAITPGNGFSMTADLILAATAVIFQLRNAWTGLSYLCLVGTYAGFLRQAVDVRGPLDFQWVGTLDFWPSAVYLTGAWLIFSAAILLSRSPAFAAGKRMAFLCLNNGAWVGLLVVAAQLGAFGHLGQILEATGFVLLAACAVAQVMQADAPDVAGAYLAQGLGLLTGGVAIVYSGVTRGLLITMESVFLVGAGAFSRKTILRLGGGATAVLGAWYLADELLRDSAFPWVLTFGGALAMLANAWLARVGRSRTYEIAEKSPLGSLSPSSVASVRRLPSDWIASSALYTILALGLLAIGICCHSGPRWIGPDLALATLVLTASIYVLPMVEWPPLAQGLLILGQLLAFGMPLLNEGSNSSSYNLFAFPQATWSAPVVALVTLLLATWWARQKVVLAGWWRQPLMGVYALAMVVYSYNTFHPHATAQTWMITAALLSLVFLAYGAWSRVWAFAFAGQILLAMAVFTYIWDIGDHGFPWAWWAAAIPIAVVFSTGWIAREILPRYVKPENQATLRFVARIYQSVSLGLLIRWVFGVTPSSEITLALLALGTAFVFGCAHLRSSYGVRAGLVLSAAGIAHYLAAWDGASSYAFTWADATAFALLLAQPALIRRSARELISDEEAWILILTSSAAGWLFVSNAVNAVDPHNLTLGWAIFALGLTVVGFAANERRQRWCGLGILVAAFIRVAVHDFWMYSDEMKVVTFLALTVICLGLSFLYFKFGDRLKEWL